MSAVRDRVRELTGKDDEMSRLMVDVLRVLVVFGGSMWRSELSQDLVKFYTIVGRLEFIDEKKVDKALKNLNKLGLVRVQERERGAGISPGKIKDKFITLTDFVGTKIALSGDRELNMYLLAAGERIRRAVGGPC